MTTEISTPRTPQKGQRVMSLSGRMLGHVADVADGQFLLDTGSERIWLDDDCIFTVDAGVVTLEVDPPQLDRCETDGPEAGRGDAFAAPPPA